jgi:L-ribulose-5-phosphate 3-epimerase
MRMLGIMQGRLVPPYPGRFQCFPKDHWREEFGIARAAGLDCIEWIVDGFGLEANPMVAPEGLDRIRAAAAATGVAVRSVCADWFMEHPLVRATPGELATRLAFLGTLLDRAGALGVTRMVIPFVDASRIDTAPETDAVVAALGEALARAETAGVELHLETSLAPAPFAALLDRLPHPLLKVNYDSGNSSSLGYAPREEFRAYGERLGSVHIKDRVLGGATVPLGTGDADFPALWEGLRDLGYRGDFILQAARGTAGEEGALAARNRRFVEDALAAWGAHGSRP